MSFSGVLNHLSISIGAPIAPFPRIITVKPLQTNIIASVVINALISSLTLIVALIKPIIDPVKTPAGTASTGFIRAAIQLIAQDTPMFAPMEKSRLPVASMKEYADTAAMI